MDLKLYLERAENELKLGQIIFELSNNQTIQLEQFNISQPDTYFSSVISHSYFCIFYAAKAYLLKKNIRTKAPQEHRKTFEGFKKLVEQGFVDVELLKIYESMIIKADSLLGIFQKEKNKRGKFTYKQLPQANKVPAEQSLVNTQTFFKHIYNLCK